MVKENGKWGSNHPKDAFYDVAWQSRPPFSGDIAFDWPDLCLWVAPQGTFSAITRAFSALLQGASGKKEQAKRQKREEQCAE